MNDYKAKSTILQEQTHPEHFWSKKKQNDIEKKKTKKEEIAVNWLQAQMKFEHFISVFIKKSKACLRFR